jgi:hypothetical protein
MTKFVCCFNINAVQNSAILFRKRQKDTILSNTSWKLYVCCMYVKGLTTFAYKYSKFVCEHVNTYTLSIRLHVCVQLYAYQCMVSYKRSRRSLLLGTIARAVKSFSTKIATFVLRTNAFSLLVCKTR